MRGAASIVRGEGGYVIAPPSRRADGAEYQFVVDSANSPAPAPQWPLDKLIVKEPKSEPRHADRNDGNRGKAYARAAHTARVVRRVRTICLRFSSVKAVMTTYVFVKPGA
jgi:hypothetical protein